MKLSETAPCVLRTCRGKLTPSRPSGSMSWLLNPVRTLCILTWRQYRLHCAVLLLTVLSLLFLALLFFSLPSELNHKLFNIAG